MFGDAMLTSSSKSECIDGDCMTSSMSIVLEDDCLDVSDVMSWCASLPDPVSLRVDV